MINKLVLIFLAIIMMACTNKEIKIDGNKSVSNFENEQKKYEEDTKKNIHNLNQRIRNFDVGSAENLRNMGTTVTVPKYY